jgi:hypothetical protein
VVDVQLRKQVSEAWEPAVVFAGVPEAPSEPCGKADPVGGGRRPGLCGLRRVVSASVGASAVLFEDV